MILSEENVEDLNIETEQDQFYILPCTKQVHEKCYSAGFYMLIIIDCKSVAKIRRRFLLRAVHNVERRI